MHHYFIKGPWKFIGGEWILGSKGEKIAQVYNWHAGYLERGRMIAASPLLLEACEHALRETIRPGSDPLIKMLKEAIRAAKED